MKGTQHFTRMNYNVRRGLREIVAPDHRVSKEKWTLVLAEFSNKCAYCSSAPSAENRGIVPDHLIAVTEFGELVPGNIVPACQTCNDSRGNKSWREFIIQRFTDAVERIKRIEHYISTHHYTPRTPESALTPEELEQYLQLIADWEVFLVNAQHLRSQVVKRRLRQLAIR